MSVEEPHLHLEVGHILFLDIVGYSKLLIDEQRELVQNSIRSGEGCCSQFACRVSGAKGLDEIRPLGENSVRITHSWWLAGAVPDGSVGRAMEFAVPLGGRTADC